MNALLERLDVDPVQWRALVRASLRVDFAAIRGAQGKAGAVKMIRGLGLAMLFYALSGLSPAYVIFLVRDILFGATFMTTIIAFMVASTMLMGEGSTIVSPNDHPVLGFRPVTSRTYLAVRVATIMIRTLVITACIAVFPVAVYLLKGGFHPGLAAAAFVAAQATGIAATLAVIAMYGWLLRVSGPARMLRYTAYVQFVAGVVTWGGFIVASQGLGRRALAGVDLSGSMWGLAYPGAWFASYVDLASGQLGWMTILPAILSIVLVALLARSISGKLSLDYSDRLGQLTTVAAPPSTAHAARWLGLLNNETRAIAILVRSQLQHDMKFRLGLISMLPITFVYMYMGGWPIDPFVVGEKRHEGSGVVQMALLFLPMTLRNVLVSSDAYRASWIFHTTPADRAKLVLSSRNIITVFFLAPYLAFLAALFAYAFQSPLHAIAHAFFTGFLSYLVLQFMVMMNPQLPFSLPHNKETRAGLTFGLMVGVTVVGLGIYFLLVKFVYRTPVRMVAAAAVLLTLAYAMDRITRRRVAKRTAETIYVG